MNIILTGMKGCGKSTLAQKVLDSYSGSVSGFRTVFENRCEEGQALYVESLDSSLRFKAAQWGDGGRTLIPMAFDSFAPSLILPNTELIFIDELGFLEKDSEALKRAVTAAFDSRQDVLAVIRIDAAGWMQELKARKDVTVIALTKDNRDSLPSHILSLLKK